MKSKKPQNSKDLRIGLSMALASSLLVLVLLEAGSYLFGSIEAPRQPLRVGNIQIFGHHDPLLFWSLQPHAKAEDGTQWINSDGIRGPEVGLKEPDEFRILSLGESTTFAAQMPYEQSYSAVLERLLNGVPRNTSTRVLNAGVPGYSLFQGVQYLQHRGLQFDPDLVLLYFGFNDSLPVAFLAKRSGDSTAQVNGLNDWELFDARQTALAKVASFLIQHSNLFRAVLNLRGQDRDENLRTQPKRPRVPTEHRERLLDLARAFCEEHQIRLVIVIPIYREFNTHIDVLREFTKSHGIDVVDLPADLPLRFTTSREAYFLDAVHPSPAGHRLIAKEIFEVVSPRIK